MPPNQKYLIEFRRDRREAVFLYSGARMRAYRFALNVTWSGYSADQIAAAKAGRYRYRASGFTPQKIRVAGGVVDSFDVRRLRLV